MNRCENCIHEKACKQLCDVHKLAFGSARFCDHFKDKSLCVELVRCKDCEYWKDTDLDTVTEVHWGKCNRPLGDYRYSETSENDFCSYAERKRG